MSRLYDPRLAAVLAREHDAAQTQAVARRAARVTTGERSTEHQDFRSSERIQTSYLAIGPDQGQLLYSLILATRAREIVEFGTSFGVSTLYLAAAASETGGRVTGSEFHASKAGHARANLAEAGLEADIRVGDARETLAAPGPEIDLLFLDGAKELYLPVLELLLPRLRTGSLVVADNIPTDEAERAESASADFCAYMAGHPRDFTFSVAGFGRGGGMSIGVRL